MNNVIDLLVCPITKGRLEYDKEKKLLISYQAKLAFKITDGIPNMLVDEAIDLADIEKQTNHLDKN